MPRDIDERKKRKALRRLRKAAELAEAGRGPPLSDWEREFLEEVEQRIETYGSAFADPSKGDREEPLSALQQVKLKEIDKKARGKAKAPMGRGSFRHKSARRDVAEHPPADPPADMGDEGSAEQAAPGKPALRVIQGGKDQ